MFRLRTDDQNAAVGRGRNLNERRDDADRREQGRIKSAHAISASPRRGGERTVDLEDRFFGVRDFGRQFVERGGDFFMFRGGRDDENLAGIGEEFYHGVGRDSLKRVDDQRVEFARRRGTELTERGNAFVANSARDRPEIRVVRRVERREGVRLGDSGLARIGAFLQLGDKPVDDAENAGNREVMQRVGRRIVQRLRGRRKDFDLFANDVVRDSFKLIIAPRRGFRDGAFRAFAARTAQIAQFFRRGIRIVYGHRRGVDFAQRVDRVDDHERVAALRTQDAVRPHERLDRRADGRHIAAFERNSERDVIETALIREIFRGNFREILERQRARFKVVQNEHVVITDQRIPFEIQVAVENVERVFRRVRRLVAVSKGSLRGSAHDELQTAFGGEPVENVGPTLLAEVHDDRFFSNTALEPLQLVGREDAFESLFRLHRDRVPFFFRRFRQLLRAFRHELVDALVLLFGQADAGRHRRIEQTRIALLRVEVGREFDGDRRLRRGRIRIRERVVHLFRERGGRGGIGGRIGNLVRGLNAYLFERGVDLFRSRILRGLRFHFGLRGRFRGWGCFGRGRRLLLRGAGKRGKSRGGA